MVSTINKPKNTQGKKIVKTKEKKFKKQGTFMAKLSNIGKALLFPIAMLPFAAILLRIGAAIPVNDDGTAFSTAVANILLSGANVIFKNLSILFGVGLAFGLTKKRRGEAALIGFVGVALVMAMMSQQSYSYVDGKNNTVIVSGAFFSSGLDLPNLFYGKLDLGQGQATLGYLGKGFHGIFGPAYNDILANNVFTGVAVGLFVAWVYNKFHKVEMPGILGFFSGSRLVPAMVIMFIMIGILAYAAIWPWVGYGIYEFSIQLSKAQGNRWSNSGIMFVFGIINRLLLPFGLHNVPNTLFWFTPVGGTAVDSGGNPVYGDIYVFLNGIPKGNHAGTFQAGFFPTFMFGLPALVIAIWHKALDKQKIKVLGLLAGSAVVSFFTGITEPVEYSFLYAAPLLYGMHVVLTGIFSFIVGAFGIQVGFGFSAGFIDYVLSIPKSLDIISDNYSGFDAVIRNPFWMIPIGLGAGATYYFLGCWMIEKFNLSTPGRNDNLIVSSIFTDEAIATASIGAETTKSKFDLAAPILLKALGGKANIVVLGNCATRLRLTLKDASIVNENELKRAGSFGLIRISDTSIQVVMGPKVEMFTNALEKIM